MPHQTKIFFTFISIVLIVVTALPSGTNTGTPTPDIKIDQCTQTSIDVTLNKKGVYYTIPSQSSNVKQAKVKEVKKLPVKATLALNGGVKVILVRIVDGVLTKDSEAYEVTCRVAKKVTISAKMDVKDITIPRKPIQADAEAEIIFTKNSQPITTAQLGDKITMTVKAKNLNVKYIEVKNCTASNQKTSKTFFPWTSNTINLNKIASDEIEFDAFRLPMDSDPNIKFSCDVVLCSDKNNCKITIYTMEQNSPKNKQVEGVLAVYLSENGILHSSGKLSSYSIGLLATMGAVFLQYQFV